MDGIPTTVELSGRSIGPGHPTFLIAEVGQAHDGSLGLAHAYIDAAAAAGADAVKFQTHIAEAESTLDEPFRVKFSQQDATRFEYWRRMEFTPEQWAGLANHAQQQNVIFLSSAFSVAAVEMLREIGVAAWKVGSGEYRSSDLLDTMSAKAEPILLSTGMSNYAEIEEAVSRITAAGSPLCLLQCTSAYPTPLEQVGLNVIDELRRRHSCPVGLSDHSGSIFPGLTAMARGANLLEVHMTFDRGMFGPDVPASVTVDELHQLAAGRDAIALMDNHPIDKDQMAVALSETRAIFTKSLALRAPHQAGTVLTSDMLTLKKPGSGIAQSEIDSVVGRQLTRDVTPDRLLSWIDIDE